MELQSHRGYQQGDDYFSMIHMQWGEGLRRVFAQLPDPDWDITAAC